MTTKTDRDIYLKRISGFVDYLVKVIRGDIEVTHRYYDYKLRERLIFKTFNDAFSQYHWDGGNYKTNEKKLINIQKKLRNAKSDADFYEACDECLEWGAGNKGLALYRHNMQWIDAGFPGGFGLKDNIEKASKCLTSDNPDYSQFGGKYRMNAGFTKIYSLYNDDFIIYDGRVGAALGYLVSRYGKNKELKALQDELRFPYGPAQGNQHRNPSIPITIYQFKPISNDHAKHALWNVRANWVLKKALDNAGVFYGYKNDQALRAIEAALFMIGYDFPELKSSVPVSKKSASTKKASSIRTGKKRSETSLSDTVKGLVDELVGSDRAHKFAPKEVLTMANTKGVSIKAEQIRSTLLRDCLNSGGYYAGGKGYYEKVKRGVFKKRWR